jgi:hypothetical protein
MNDSCRSSGTRACSVISRRISRRFTSTPSARRSSWNSSGSSGWTCARSSAGSTRPAWTRSRRRRRNLRPARPPQDRHRQMHRRRLAPRHARRPRRRAEHQLHHAHRAHRIRARAHRAHVRAARHAGLRPRAGEPDQGCDSAVSNVRWPGVFAKNRRRRKSLAIQSKGSYTAFIHWPFQRENTPLGRAKEWDPMCTARSTIRPMKTFCAAASCGWPAPGISAHPGHRAALISTTSRRCRAVGSRWARRSGNWPCSSAPTTWAA